MSHHQIQMMGGQIRMLQQELANKGAELEGMKANNEQANFIEALTASALGGYCAAGKDPAEAAKLAQEAATKSMEQIITAIREANRLENEQSEEEAKVKAGSVGQVLAESEKHIAKQKEPSKLIL